MPTSPSAVALTLARRAVAAQACGLIVRSVRLVGQAGACDVEDPADLIRRGITPAEAQRRLDALEAACAPRIHAPDARVHRVATALDRHRFLDTARLANAAAGRRLNHAPHPHRTQNGGIEWHHRRPRTDTHAGDGQ